MGDHFVPQYYLQGFTHDGVLWVHDRLEERSFATQTKAVANETRMYPPELERFLANVIEHDAKAAIAAIRERRPLIDTQREALATYLFVLWKRVPRGRARALSHVPAVVSDLRTEIHQKLDAAAGDRPQFEELAVSKKAAVDQYLADYERDHALDLWHHTLESPASRHVVDSLLSMEWTFLEDRKRAFVTCDNPVFFFDGEGIEQPTSELTLPFSSGVALWATRRQRHCAGRYLAIAPRAVREFNRRASMNAERFVYSERNESWMLPFFCKRDHRLTRLA